MPIPTRTMSPFEILEITSLSTAQSSLNLVRIRDTQYTSDGGRRYSLNNRTHGRQSRWQRRITEDGSTADITHVMSQLSIAVTDKRLIYDLLLWLRRILSSSRQAWVTSSLNSIGNMHQRSFSSCKQRLIAR